MKWYFEILVLVIFFISWSQANALVLKSPEFSDGDKLPIKSGSEKGNVSTPLVWEDIPEKTASFVLIMDDPDANGWVHWLVYNIPASVNSLKEDFPRDEKLRDGTLQGVNSSNKLAYGGPRPPSGTHRYVFKLYALDTVLDLKPGAQKQDLLKIMKGHVLQETSLMGKFSK